MPRGPGIRGQTGLCFLFDATRKRAALIGFGALGAIVFAAVLPPFSEVVTDRLATALRHSRVRPHASHLHAGAETCNAVTGGAAANAGLLDVLVHEFGAFDDHGPDDGVDDQSDDDFHVRPLPWGLRRPRGGCKLVRRPGWFNRYCGVSSRPKRPAPGASRVPRVSPR
jgi:hypothetical protein